MKALVLNQIKQPLGYEEQTDPCPIDGQVLVELKAAALNRRDFWITQGLYPGIECPIILGSDGAGVVIEVGEGVDGDWVGREVIINPGYDWGDRQEVQCDDFTILGLPKNGTFAERIAVPLQQIHLKPEHLTLQQAAALPLAGLTAYRALMSRGCFARPQKVLITGIGGGVATFALKFAVAAGAEVVVTSSSPEKIERAVSMGAAAGFDYTAEDWTKQLLSEFGAVDLAIDGAGGQGADALIDIAAMAGRIVNYGATQGPADSVDLRKVFWKQLNLLGSTMGSPADFQGMLDLVAEHGIEPAIDSVFPLCDGNIALEHMEVSSQFGKLVLAIES